MTISYSEVEFFGKTYALMGSGKSEEERGGESEPVLCELISNYMRVHVRD